jgi:hypothetical protein
MGVEVQSTLGTTEQQFTEEILSSATATAGFIDIQVIAQDDTETPKVIKTITFRGIIEKSISTATTIMQETNEPTPIVIVLEQLETEKEERISADNFKADKSDTYTKTEIDTALEKKQDATNILQSTTSLTDATVLPIYATGGGNFKSTLSTLSNWLISVKTYTIDTIAKTITGAINELKTSNDTKLNKDLSNCGTDIVSHEYVTDDIVLPFLKNSTNGKLALGIFSSWLTLTKSYNGLNTSNKTLISAINEILTKLNGLSFWKGTQAEYDAITIKDENTLYIITGGT